MGLISTLNILITPIYLFRFSRSQREILRPHALLRKRGKLNLPSSHGATIVVRSHAALCN